MNPVDDFRPHLGCLDSQQSTMLEQVIALCNLNSGTMNLAGLEQVKQQLVEYYADLGGELVLRDSLPRMIIDDRGREIESPLGQSIHIRKRLEAARKVLLCIHMDTVYGIDDPFQQCRLLENGTLNGPGVADAKGGLVVMLHALKAFEASPLADRLGWEVLINPDEEIGSPGSLPLIQEIAPRCDFGLIFEPALDASTIVSWRKGSGNFDFVVKGRSAHAGREFELGRNAVAAAARLATAIDQLNTDPEVTYNIGKLTGGGALNVVPDTAVLRVNVRVKTTVQQQQAESQLRELVESANRDDGIVVTQYGGFSSPPKPLTPELEILQQRIERCGQMLDTEIQWRGTGGASDGNKFAAAGLTNVDSLGPVGGRIHSDEEFLVPESLVPRAQLAALILMQYASE